MAEDLDLPDEVFGFGSWLLWVLAARATTVVDEAVRGWPGSPVPALWDGGWPSGAHAVAGRLAADHGGVRHCPGSADAAGSAAG